MEEATGAPSSLAVCYPKRPRASGRDRKTVMTEPPSPLTMLLSRHTRRREFITLVGAAAAWPLEARGQQATKHYRIGMLFPTSPMANAANLNAFRQRLQELGYVEGRTLVIDYRSAEGRPDRFPVLAAELVNLKADLIMTRGTPAALAAKSAPRTIPVVMAAIGEAVETGVVAGIAHPGGNITGLSSFIADVVSKRLELLS